MSREAVCGFGASRTRTGPLGMCACKGPPHAAEALVPEG